MLYEKTGIIDAIERNFLPSSLQELFGDLYDEANQRFLMQETTVIDFKEGIPRAFSDEYGASIVRLALSFYNTFGGLIVFGVVDRTFSALGQSELFNIEGFNRTLSDTTGHSIECSFRRYDVRAEAAPRFVQVVLIPPRCGQKPARLTRPLYRYPKGALWVRDRHEVCVASRQHLPLLYGDRSGFLSQGGHDAAPVHRSLPPHPALMEEFIGRLELSEALWDWLVFGSQPRLYLHGPGGSGKSTLAYEFAATIADADIPIKLRNGHNLDYVLFLSAKETEFAPIIREDGAYRLRDFSTAEEQFSQILFHSGLLSQEELRSAGDMQKDEHLTYLMNNFAGLIVIDDIDTPSRRGEDTGEESLFLKAAQSNGRTKILYTLRFAPPYAVNISREVPSLDFKREYHAFIDACCEQFDVAVPNPASSIQLFEESAGLPLLIETIVGLRRTCSTYDEALNAYKAREGDAARRYLYQREYDRLDSRGKSRQLLAALSLIESAVSFRTIAHLTSASEAQIRDAIVETKGIFLRSFDTDEHETLYEVTRPARGFIQQISQSLPFYPALEQAIAHFKKEKIGTSSGEAAIIVNLNKLARQNAFELLVEAGSSIPTHDKIWGNPTFLGLLGQGYAHLGGAKAEDARECFRRAFALHHRDIFMLRAWYRLEYLAPHTVKSAEELCRSVLATQSLAPRYRSEFHSKLGQSLEAQARPHVFTNRERAVELMTESLFMYFEGARTSRTSGLDPSIQSEWVTQAVGKFFRIIGDDPSPLFTLVDGLIASGTDIDLDAARILLEPVKRSAANNIGAGNKLRGLARSSGARISKLSKALQAEPGITYVREALQEIATS